MVDAILEPDSSELFNDEEKAAIALSIESTRRVRISDATFERARRFFTPQQLLELVVNIGVANLTNRVTDGFQADIEE